MHSQAWTFVTHTWALWLFERRYNELMAGHAGLAESFYCVIITASTVGYGDTPFRNKNTLLCVNWFRTGVS